MGSKLYSQGDVRRLLAALGVFIAVPCILLVFLAWQSVRILHKSAQAQQRESCRRELWDIGLQVHGRLEDLLARAGDPLRARSPSEAAFWSDARRLMDAEPAIRTLLALDAAGQIAWPRPGQASADDLPRLSSVHPAYVALESARRAHWADGDFPRALDHYRQVLTDSRTPPAIRMAVWAEMAACARRQGDVPAALEAYRRMLTETPEAAPPALAWSRAIELARESGDDVQAQSWTQALLADCDRRGMDLNLDELAIVAARLRAGHAGMSDDLAEPLERMERLVAARAAATVFIRARGSGPFRSGFLPLGFALATRFGPSLSLLLVETRETLSDGSRLAFEIDWDAWRAAELEPALRELAARRGGRATLIPTPPPDSQFATPVADRMIQLLPVPLEAWSIEYRAEAASMWSTLAATRSNSRVALLGLAAGLAMLGLVVPFIYLRRSLRLAGLQADVMDRISHELKTPISSLAVLTDTLQRRGATAAPAADRQVRMLLHDEVQRLVRLSDRLLDFARQRTGPVPLAREPARLDNLLAEIVHRLPAETGIEAGRLACIVQPADYAGEFDREALGEILRNLLENAVKYAAGPAEVRLALRRDGPEAVLEVADNGPGMESRTLRHLFTPYFRADARLAARVPGLGLGLAIVKGLVHGHGGTISVRSEPGRGSTFAIRLPLAADSGGRA